MIDNFDTFKREFKDGEFYFIQIIKRGKDNPGVRGINGNNSERVIKEYSIHDQTQLDKRKQEMIDISNACNARVYIHPARRSKIEISKLMVLLLGEHIALGRHGLSGLYRHACGYSKGTQRIWIVDLDGINYPDSNILDFITNLRPIGDKIIQILPTKNGCHLICNPFDLGTFKEIYPNIDVHKNNPTLLYFK